MNTLVNTIEKRQASSIEAERFYLYMLKGCGMSEAVFMAKSVKEGLDVDSIILNAPKTFMQMTAGPYITFLNKYINRDFVMGIDLKLKESTVEYLIDNSDVAKNLSFFSFMTHCISQEKGKTNSRELSRDNFRRLINKSDFSNISVDGIGRRISDIEGTDFEDNILGAYLRLSPYLSPNLLLSQEELREVIEKSDVNVMQGKTLGIINSLISFIGFYSEKDYNTKELVPGLIKEISEDNLKLIIDKLDVVSAKGKKRFIDTIYECFLTDENIGYSDNPKVLEFLNLICQRKNIDWVDYIFSKEKKFDKLAKRGLASINKDYLNHIFIEKKRELTPKIRKGLAGFEVGEAILLTRPIMDEREMLEGSIDELQTEAGTQRDTQSAKFKL